LFITNNKKTTPTICWCFFVKKTFFAKNDNMKKLQEYQSKRNFNLTSEPSANTKPNKKTKKPIFVVQHHLATTDHYDFRLEHMGVLLSWAVPKGPSFFAQDKRLAIMVEDHPLSYATFEGNIPKGQYGGGVVMLWDKGTFEPLTDIDEGLKKGVLKFELFGKRLVGKWTLFLIDQVKGKQQWILNKEKDEFEGKTDIAAYQTSVKTGRTMAQIENNIQSAKNNFAKAQKQILAITPSQTQAQVGNLKITNPNKVVCKKPKTTKKDVLFYYSVVAKRMLPYLQNRLVSVVRCPQGCENECFFKKHPVGENAGILSVPVKDEENGQYFCITNLDGLLFEAQMNTIEFHTWASTIDNFEKPSIMVFDLDPDKGLGIEKVRQGVKDLKSILDKLGLQSFLKTSGGKGYHVVVPFLPSVDWQQFADFAKQVAMLMAQTWPERYTTNIRKQSRKNKIFVDWQRNTRAATSVAPYSLRARSGFPVSAPIFWKELNTIAPNDIDMQTAMERAKKRDPWQKFFSVKQKLQ
jgi:DNA ligase D-like protein (predicted polymerase)/DNA ligase D-like protein (predicted 3'-phosphoesterase)